MAGTRTAERGEERRLAAGAEPPGPRRRLPAFLRLPRPRRPRGPRALLLLALLLAALLGFGGWALYGSPWLRVEQTSVSWRDGPRQLSERQILAAAEVPVGSPMASLDKGAVRERLLDALPRVASVEVVRDWPHGVSLKVTEREAELVIRSAGGYTEVDRSGVPFAEVARPDPGVPLLEMGLGQSGSRLRFGEDRVLAGAVTVAVALPDAVRREVGAIRVTSYDAVTLELSGNRTVFWGSPEDSAAKADSLTLLLKAAEGATHFDVSVPSAPAASGG